jgi:predicted lipid-binding transport protein (Tim44 family)
VEPGSANAEALSAIRAACSGFDGRRFLQGAVAAYEAVLTAFQEGDLCVLADLTSADVYETFIAAIAEREKHGEHFEWTLLSIEAVTLVDAAIVKESALITLRFSSRFAQCRSGHAGDLADGSSEKLVRLTDDWTFARELRSHDPKWKLVATGSA